MNVNRHAFRRQKSRLLQAFAKRFSARSLEAPTGDFQPMKQVQRKNVANGLLALCMATFLAACSSGGSFNIANSQSADPSTNDYPIFYVKRTIPTAANIAAGADDVRMMRVAFASADLYMRASASPSAKETNITSRITTAATNPANTTWDVKDVDASADGTRVVFAMRGPMTAKMKQKDAPSWRIYEYVITTDALQPVIDPTVDPDPPTVNDVSPHFMPDGRIVFSSTRQSQSQGILLDEGKPQFIYNNEANTEPAFVLEVMNEDGTGVHQISFNQSNDRTRRYSRPAACCGPAGTMRRAARTPCTSTPRIRTARIPSSITAPTVT